MVGVGAADSADQVIVTHRVVATLSHPLQHADDRGLSERVPSPRRDRPLERVKLSVAEPYRDGLTGITSGPTLKVELQPQSADR